ncbi:MAG: DUF2934 domain-containing protein [bacterium]
MPNPYARQLDSLPPLQTGPTPLPDGDESKNPDYDLVPNVGPPQVLEQTLPIQQAQVYQDAERAMYPLEMMGSRLTALFTGDQDQELQGAGQGVRRQEGEQGWAKFVAAEDADRQRFQEFTQHLDGRGVKYEGGRKDLIEGGEAYLTRWLGPEWELRATPEQARQFRAMGRLNEAVTKGVLKEPDQAAVSIRVRDKMLSQLKIAPANMGTGQFEEDMRLFDLWGKTYDNPALLNQTWGGHQLAQRANERLARWYYYQHGVEAKDVPRADMHSFAKALAYGYDGLRQKAVNALKWQAVGATVGEQDMLEDGTILPGTMPFYRKTVLDFQWNRENNAGQGDLARLTQFNARQRVQELLTERPGTVLTKLLPEAEQNPKLRDYVSKLTGELANIEDPTERHRAFRKAINSPSAAERKVWELASPRGYEPNSGWTQEEWAALSAMSTRLDSYETYLSGKDLERQQKLDQLRPSGWDPEASIVMADWSRQRGLAEQEYSKKLAQGLANAPITNTILWPLKAMDYLVKKTGVASLNRALLQPAMAEIAEAALNTPQPEGLNLVLPEPSVFERFTRDVIGYKHDPATTQQRYAERTLAGETTWLDDLWLLTSTVGDGLARLPQLGLEDPMTFAAFGAVAGKWGKVAGKVGDTMVAAGVPVRVAGLAEMALNPVAGQGMGKVLNMSPKLVRLLGAWPGRVVKMLNQLHKDPALAAKVSAYWNKYMSELETGARASRPEELISKGESTLAALLVKGRKGEVRANDLWNMDLSMLSDVEARQIFLPFARAKLSIGSGGAEAAAQFASDVGSLAQLETALRMDKTAATKMGRSLTELYVDAHNAVAKGMFPVWRKALDSHMAQKLMAPESRQRWLEYFDRSVKLADVAPHVTKGARDAMTALAAHSETVAEVATLFEWGKEYIQIRKAGLESDLRVIGHQETLQKEAYLIAERNGFQGAPKDYWAQAEQAMAQRKAGAERKLASMDNHRLQLESEIRNITELSKVDISGQHGTVGLEAGTRHNLTPEVQRFLVDGMFDLVETHGEGILHDLGLPAVWARHYTAIQEAAAKPLHKIERRINRTARALEKGDVVRAAKIAGLPEGATAQDILAKTGELHEQAAAQRAGLRDSARELARQKMPKSLFQVPTLAEAHQQVLQVTRRHAEAMNDLAQMESGPAATYLELINLKKNPHYYNRAMGLVDVYTTAQNNINTLMLNRLQRNINRLPLGDQRTLNQILSGELEASAVGGELAKIAFDDAHLRNMVLDLMVQRGKLTKKQADIFKITPYEDHYYLAHTEAAKFRAQGTPLNRETEMQANTGPARLPEHEAIQAQRSFRHARVRLRGGEVKYFTLEENGGKATKANEAARGWVKEQLDSHELRKEDVLGIDEAMGEKEAAILGFVGTDGTLRVDRIRRLFADAMRDDFFAHVAMMPGLKRTNVQDLPLKRRREWTNKALVGKDWGALEGFYVHKSVLRMMNTWDQWHEVMDAAAESVKQQIGEVWTPTGYLERIMYGEQSEGLVARIARRVDKQWRHNFIIRNPGSWVNNHLGGLVSSIMSGAAPWDPRFHQARHRFYDLLDEMAKGAGKNRGEPETARALDEHTLFNDVAMVGGLTPSGGLTGKLHLEEATTWGALGKRVKDGIRAEQNRLVNDLFNTDSAITRLELVMSKGKLKDAEARRASDMLEALDTKRRELQRELRLQDMRSPEVDMASLGKEAWRTLANPEKSQLSQWLANRYGLVDPSYRYATYHYLRTARGYSKERALDTLQELFQNYSAVPPWVRTLQSVPVFGAFVPSFAYEAGRLVANALYHDPGKFLALSSVPFVWNMANMSANGIMPSEYFATTSARTWTDQLKEMCTTLRVDVGDTMLRWNVSQASYLAPFLSSSGAFKLLADRMGEWQEQNLPYAASIPMAALGNYASNFVANNPLAEMVTTHGLGLNVRERTVSYGRFADISPLKGLGSELLSTVVPRVLLRAGEEAGTVGMSSLLTKHNKSALMAGLRTLTGQPVSATPRREMFARMILKYANVERLGSLMRDAQTDDEMERRSLILKAGQEPDPEKRAVLIREAARVIKEMKSGKVLIGETWVDVGVSDERALRLAIEQASANLYSEIEHIPLDKLPMALFDIETSTLAHSNRSEVEHMWRQLTDANYMAGRGDLAELATTAQQCFQYADTALRPEVRAKYMVGAVTCLQQIQRRIQTMYSANQLGALKGKIGAMPAAMQRLMMQHLGL